MSTSLLLHNYIIMCNLDSVNSLPPQKLRTFLDALTCSTRISRDLIVELSLARANSHLIRGDVSI